MPIQTIVFLAIFLANNFFIQISVCQRVITIDQIGSDTLKCCVNGNCPCSNISLALTHIQDCTEIRVMSNTLLHHDVEINNVSLIIITGHNNPTIMCDHQGGLVGNYIKQITIQNIIWDKCNGIIMDGFTDAYITDCTFQYSTNFTLTLDGFGSVHINGTSFSHNHGGVDALAPSIIVYNSNFYGTIKYEAFHVNTTIDVSITIIACSFTNNSGYGVSIIGDRFTPTLLISYCVFTNNTNSSVVSDNVDITLLHNVTFYNNVVVDTSGELSEDGAAIRVYNSTVSVNGTVMFCNNKAGGNGGAVYLLYSTVLAQQKTITFYNNTADNGGAIYIGRGSGFYINTTAIIQFELNTARSYGGAIYVDLYQVHDITLVQTTTHHYHKLVNYNSSNEDNGVYCNTVFNNSFSAGKLNYHCDSGNSYYTKAQVIVNSNDIIIEEDTEHVVEIWLHNLKLDPITTSKCFKGISHPINCTFGCEFKDNRVTTGCIIDSVQKNFTIVANDTGHTAINCSLFGNYIMLNVYTSERDDPITFYVKVWWNKYLHNCEGDISHVAVPGHGCLPLSCELLEYFDSLPSGLHCKSNYIDNTPGYWYSNGFNHLSYWPL